MRFPASDAPARVAMIYSDRKRFIFFAAGKTATTSIEQALAEYADKIPFEYDAAIFDKHIPPEYARAHLPEDVWSTYFKFAFVRNPWDWVMSWYLFTWETIFTPFRRSVWCWPYYYYALWKRNRGRFDERCFWLFWNNMKRYRRGIDSDNRYQHRFLSDAVGNILVDFVGRYERLQDDFDYACDMIGVPRRELAFENRGEIRRGDTLRDRRLAEFYTPAVVELVGDHYARDIREFSYRFEEPPAGVEIVQTVPSQRQLDRGE